MLSPLAYKRLRYALALKSKSLGVPVRPGYRTTLMLPPGRVMRAQILDVQNAAAAKGLYHGPTDGTLNTVFQRYLIPPPPVDVNVEAAKWLLAHQGPKENLGANSGTWLNAEEDAMGESYMHAGHAPWCAAMGGRRAYMHAGVDVESLFPGLNQDYCPSWEELTRRGAVSKDGHWKLVQVPLGLVRYGDFLLFDWPGESPGVADHFGRALGAVTTSGDVRTVECNTQPSSSGNQSDGGGIYTKLRFIGEIRCAGRLVRMPA